MCWLGVFCANVDLSYLRHAMPYSSFLLTVTLLSDFLFDCSLARSLARSIAHSLTHSPTQASQSQVQVCHRLKGKPTCTHGTKEEHECCVCCCRYHNLWCRLWMSLPCGCLGSWITFRKATAARSLPSCMRMCPGYAHLVSTGVPPQASESFSNNDNGNDNSSSGSNDNINH